MRRIESINSVSAGEKVVVFVNFIRDRKRQRAFAAARQTSDKIQDFRFRIVFLFLRRCVIRNHVLSDEIVFVLENRVQPLFVHGVNVRICGQGAAFDRRVV